jgi:hypothetical protein
MLANRSGPSSSGQLKLTLWAGNTGVVGPKTFEIEVRPFGEKW